MAGYWPFANDAADAEITVAGMENSLPTDEAWTAAQVARFLQTTARNVRDRVGVDGFPAPRTSLGPRSWRWSRRAVEEWLATAPPPAPVRRNGPRAVVERV